MGCYDTSASLRAVIRNAASCSTDVCQVAKSFFSLLGLEQQTGGRYMYVLCCRACAAPVQGAAVRIHKLLQYYSGSADPPHMIGRQAGRAAS